MFDQSDFLAEARTTVCAVTMAEPPGVDAVDWSRLLLFGAARPEWHQRASCRDRGPGLFFPEGRGSGPGPARAICSGCPVRHECAEAGKGEVWGVWGGLSPVERRRQGDRPVPIGLDEPVDGAVGCGRPVQFLAADG